MNRVRKYRKFAAAGGVLAAGAVGASIALPALSSAAPSTQVVYNAIPKTLPPHLASVAYQSTQSDEIGQEINLGAQSGPVQTVNAVVTSFQTAAAAESTASTFAAPMTLNIYAVNPDGTRGTLLVTHNQTFQVPFDSSANTSGHAGINHEVSFDLSGSKVTLPNNVIVGVEWSSADWGPNPSHNETDPMAFLNIAVVDTADVSVGGNVAPGTAYYQSETQAKYGSEVPASDVGQFVLDTNSTDFVSTGDTVGWAVGADVNEGAADGNYAYHAGDSVTPAIEVIDSVTPPATTTTTPPKTTPPPATHGYYEVASDGGVFTFGGARFFGSMGGHHLNAPIVGIAVTPDHGGYWEVASDGGIFAFGDAPFLGSEGGHHLNQPIIGIETSSNGKGYALVARDGGLFTFGDFVFSGSEGGSHLNAPIVGSASF